MPSEMFSIETLGKDMETVWRLSLYPYVDTGNLMLMIQKGKTEGLAYKLNPEQARSLATVILEYYGN